LLLELGLELRLGLGLELGLELELVMGLLMRLVLRVDGARGSAVVASMMGVCCSSLISADWAGTPEELHVER